MEKLKAAVPESLRRRIAESTPDDLASTSSALLDFFHNLPLFHQVVAELTGAEGGLCCKDEKKAVEFKLKGNDCFSKGDFTQAVKCYTKALRFARINVGDAAENVEPVLYVNRAFALYKMGHLVESLRDSNRALSISPVYSKAWFRRGKANASLGHHHDALQDFNVSLNLELSLNGKKMIENEIRMIVKECKETNCSFQKSEECRSEICDDPHQIELRSASTITKGRGMIAPSEISEASLIHKEDPYAAIILKPCRETHCHFCFSELPMDAVPCSSCYIPLYCSRTCQVQAGGEKLHETVKHGSSNNNLSEDLQKYISDVLSVEISQPWSKKFTEHVHECEGMHWPLVLPSDVVLAGRVLVKYIEQQRLSSLTFSLSELWDLCHNYVRIPSDNKLEFHVYAIMLINCLQGSYGVELPTNGSTISQLIILFSQVRLNSMAIVHLTSYDMTRSVSQQAELSINCASTASLNQIRVGQAVYLGGSLFNHSCQPNIHAYFVSRTLYVRATEFIASGCELELSYGAQVGQWNCKDRKQFLEDRYSFSCECRGCSQLNVSDLVLDGYRCVKRNCLGVVLDNDVAKYENQKVCGSIVDPGTNDSKDLNQVEKCHTDDIRKVACRVLENFHLFQSDHCLNCNTKCDIEASHEAIRESELHLTRLRDAILSNNVTSDLLREASRTVDLLATVLHPFNKKIAEVKDSLAQALCLVGDLHAAVGHCRESIEILEMIYGPDHIAIGNELLKLTSIQLALRDSTAADNLKRVLTIFSRYYGVHASHLFPLLQHLGEEAHQIQAPNSDAMSQLTI